MPMVLFKEDREGSVKHSHTFFLLLIHWQNHLLLKLLYLLITKTSLSDYIDRFVIKLTGFKSSQNKFKLRFNDNLNVTLFLLMQIH